MNFTHFNSLELPVVVEHLPSGALLCLLHPKAGLDSLDNLDNLDNVGNLDNLDSLDKLDNLDSLTKCSKSRENCSSCLHGKDLFS